MKSFTESGVQMVAQGVTHQDSKPLVRDLNVVLFHRLSNTGKPAGKNGLQVTLILGDQRGLRICQNLVYHSG